MEKIYAHTINSQPSEKWQLLDDHLKNVAEMAATFAKEFCSDELAYNAGWLHDLGKADSAFQGYLHRENGLDDTEYDTGRVNHSSAGAALAEEKLGPLVGRIHAYLSAGHHAGLPDWHAVYTGNAALSVRLVEGRENLERIRQYTGEILPRLIPKITPPPYLIKKPEYFHLWVRMIFSCLVDADYLDTEAFMKQGQDNQRGDFKSIEGLRTIYDASMADMKVKAPKTNVNSIRQDVLAACREAAEIKPGLFSLTVPTGGGKTLSSMAFALDHAVKYGKNRIIYVIPYTSIIEQTAKILADIFGRDNIVEHHSNLEPTKETPRASLAAENWDAPIIVTTNVQFFESLYAAKPSRCRKLHNIVNSVVILDEAQLLPPNLLTPCVDAMNQLVNNYGVTLLLATATQPALPGLEPTEIIKDTKILYDRLKRTEINIPRDLNERTSWEDLALKLQNHEQVLCVVNTRRDCHDLYKLMPEGTIHLSALMCGRHRTAMIRLIKCRLLKGMPIRVISTQLVEAGVDIDFPVVYRAFAGLSSIAQAAGRCNREGKLNDEGRMGQVNVFVPPKASPPGVLRKAEDTTRELYASPAFDPQQSSEYIKFFNLLYSRLNDTGKNWLHDRLVKDVNPNLYFQFRTADNEFKMIDDQAQRPVIVRYGRSDALIKRLRFAGPTREIMRALQRYTVNLPVRMVDRMLSDGTLERIDHEKARDIVVQSCLRLYNKKVGLDVYAENLPIEDLLI